MTPDQTPKQRAEATSAHMRAVCITVYAPARFLVCHLVREANWKGQAAGSGKMTLCVLCLCMSLQMALKNHKAIPADCYTSALSATMLCATRLQSSVSGAAYGEEFCESLLGRFSRLWQQTPSCTTPEGLSDLFV